MKLLLDTHILLWWLGDAPELSKQARVLIADPTHTVFISAATLWEMRIKQKLGKLKVPGNLMACVKAEEFEWVPLSPEHVDATLDLPMLHRDPFDRMLVAQAKCLGLTLSQKRQLEAVIGTPLSCSRNSGTGVQFPCKSSVSRKSSVELQPRPGFRRPPTP